jgi:hypothetical protein
MIFLFKRKEIVVDCFTYHHSVYEYYRPLNANNFIPDGWKKLPKRLDIKTFPNVPSSKLTTEAATAKTCLGFINLFRTGFIIQNHCEIAVESDEAGNVNVDSLDRSSSFISQHSPEQVWDGFFTNHAHIKLIVPWFVKEKTGVNFLYSKCTWNDTNMADNFHVVSGILDFKLQHNISVNFFMKKNSIVRFYAGQPLAHVIPLSEHKVKMKHHLISRQEYETRFSFIPATRLYQEFKRIKTKKECPFGFGR